MYIAKTKLPGRGGRGRGGRGCGGRGCGEQPFACKAEAAKISAQSHI